MALETRSFYDSYWRARDCERTEARSRERAALALDLLGRVEAGQPRPGKRLLELGCGPGWALEKFRAAGFEVEGVDASEVAVEAAAKRGLAVKLWDLERDPLDALAGGAAGGYDVVVALEVLEHLSDPLGLLSGVRALLRRGAIVVVSLPNEVHLLARLKVLCGRLPFGGHADPHLRHFDRRRARLLFEAAGYEAIAERAASIVPPRRSLLRRLAAPAVRLVPGAFSIATVYLLGETRHDG